MNIKRLIASILVTLMILVYPISLLAINEESDEGPKANEAFIKILDKVYGDNSASILQQSKTSSYMKLLELPKNDVKEWIDSLNIAYTKDESMVDIIENSIKSASELPDEDKEFISRESVLDNKLNPTLNARLLQDGINSLGGVITNYILNDTENRESFCNTDSNKTNEWYCSGIFKEDVTDIKPNNQLQMENILPKDFKDANEGGFPPVFQWNEEGEIVLPDGEDISLNIVSYVMHAQHGGPARPFGILYPKGRTKPEIDSEIKTTYSRMLAFTTYPIEFNDIVMTNKEAVKNYLPYYQQRIDIIKKYGEQLQKFVPYSNWGDTLVKEADNQFKHFLDMLGEANANGNPSDPVASDGTKLKKSQAKEVTEALDEYPGIWSYDTGFSDAYKGLFAWTAAFTPFKTNLYDATNMNALTGDERELFKKYGSNRSILYKPTSSKGVLKNIETGAVLNFEAISLADFIKKAPTEELALFVRHQNSNFFLNTGDEISEVKKDANIDKSSDVKLSEDLKAEEIIDEEEGKTGEIDKTAVGTIEDEVGKFVIDKGTSTEFLGPFYITSGQYGKDILTLDDASSNVFLKGSMYDESELILKINDLLVAASNDESLPDDVRENLKNEKSRIEAERDSKKKITILRSIFDGLSDGAYGKYKDAIADMEARKDEAKAEVNARKETVETYKNNRENMARDLQTKLQIEQPKIYGNQANINYVLMYNSLIDARSNMYFLEDDMQKPLYIDFLGNITTYSGIVVVPAAANTNMYSAADTPMGNAMFLNGYPELRMDSNSIYKLASNISKRKYIMSVLEGGMIRFFKPMIGDSAIGNGDEIFSLPLISTYNLDLYGDDKSKQIFLIDYKKDYKPSEDPLFDGKLGGDIKSKIFVNNGAVIQKITPDSVEAINTKKISTSGGQTDWKVLKELNQAYVKVAKPLNEMKLVQAILSSQKHKDQMMNVKIDTVLSETSILRNDKLVSFFGGIFEGINNKILSKLKKNFLMYTPTQDKLPVFPNAGLYTQRFMILAILIMFLYLLARFMIFVISKQAYRAKPVLMSFIALILIGGSVLYLVNPIINILFNKPADALLKQEVPVYVLEMVENNYKEQDNNFFSKENLNSELEPGNPTITVQKLNNETNAYIRASENQTGELKDKLYIPKYDQRKIKVQGHNIYAQGDELKVDIDKLFQDYRIERVKTGMGTYLDLAITRGEEVQAYMPFAQFLRTLTDTINENAYESLPPINRIQYRHGFSKTTGAAESYFKSIVFIAPEKIKDLRDTLAEQYKINIKELDNYTTDYIKQKMGIETLSDEMLKAIDDPEYTIEGTLYDENGNPIVTQDQLEFDRRKSKILKDLEVLDSSYSQLLAYSEAKVDDWLGIRYILGLEENEDVIPAGQRQAVFEARWYPANLRDETGGMTEEIYKQTWQKIVRINEKTRKFVLNKIMPISGEVSDDSVIKTVALYAITEFNKEFSVAGHELYPKKINTDGLSNEFITRASFVPRDDIFISKYSQISEYLATKSGWTGLAVASVDRVAYIARMLIRIILITFLLLATPLLALYWYVVKGDKNDKPIKGAVVNILLLAFLYIGEIFLFKLNIFLINNTPLAVALLINLVLQIALLGVYVKILTDVLGDILNLGFGNIMERMNVIRGGKISEEEYATAAEMVYDDIDDTNDLHDMFDYSITDIYDEGMFEDYVGNAEDFDDYQAYDTGNISNSEDLASSINTNSYRGDEEISSEDILGEDDILSDNETTKSGDENALTDDFTYSDSESYSDNETYSDSEAYTDSEVITDNEVETDDIISDDTISDDFIDYSLDQEEPKEPGEDKEIKAEDIETNDDFIAYLEHRAMKGEEDK